MTNINEIMLVLAKAGPTVEQDLILYMPTQDSVSETRIYVGLDAIDASNTNITITIMYKTA